MALLFLKPPRCLKQVRVDGKAHQQRPLQDRAGRLANGFAKGVLQPVLEKVVGNADGQMHVVPGELRVPVKPELVAWLSNALGDGLSQLGHDVALADPQGLLLGARTCRSAQTSSAQEKESATRREDPPRN